MAKPFDVADMAIDTSESDRIIGRLHKAQEESEQLDDTYLKKFDADEWKRYRKDPKSFESQTRPRGRPQDELHVRITKLKEELEECNRKVIMQCEQKQDALLRAYRTKFNIDLKKESLKRFRERASYYYMGGTPKRSVYITCTDGDTIYKSEIELALETDEDTNLVSMNLYFTKADRDYHELPSKSEHAFHAYQLVRHLLDVLFTQMIYKTTNVDDIESAQHYYGAQDGLFRTRNSTGDLNLSYTMSDEGARAVGNIMFGLIDEHLQDGYDEVLDKFIGTFMTDEIESAAEFCNAELQKLATEESDQDAVRDAKRVRTGFASTAPTDMLVRLRL